MIRPPSNVMSMNPPFIAPSSQPGQPTQPPQPHLSMLAGNPNANSQMGLLGAQPNANGPTNYQNLQMQQQQMARAPVQHRNPALMQQGHPGAGMNPGMLSNPNFVNGMGPTSLQQMQFGVPGQLMPNQVRRTVSQQQPMPQPGMAGMHPGQHGMAGMPGVTVNGMPQMDPATRQRFMQHQQQQQQQIRHAMQQQHQQQLNQHPHSQPQPGQHQMQGPNGISAEMMMNGRPGLAGGAFPIARAPSQPQPAPGIPQPPSLPPTHGGGMQSGAQFMQLNQQFSQHPMGTSPLSMHTNPTGMVPNSMPNNGGMPQNVPQNRARMTPDSMGGNFPNPQMNGLMPRNAAQMVAVNGQPFAFGNTPHSPNNLADLPPSMQMGTPRAGNQQPLISTPAQALDLSQSDSFSVSMGPPSNPTRPPSQQQRHAQGFPMNPQQHPTAQPQPPQPRQHTPHAQHQSPRQHQQLMQAQQRPPSQPQVHPAHSPRHAQQPPPQPHQQQHSPTPQQQPHQLHQPPPPQQQQQQQQQHQQQHQQQQQQQPQPGPSRTPRTGPNPLPGMQPPVRHGPPPTQAQQVAQMPAKPPTPAGGQQVPVAARPGQVAPPVVGGPPARAMTGPGPMQGLPMRRMQPLSQEQQEQEDNRAAIVNVMWNPLFLGPGVLFLESFSGALEGKIYEMLSLDYWTNVVQDYFLQDSIFKFTLWKDSMKQEAKPFEIGTAILPRFFLVTAQSGVTNMRLSLQGALETKYVNNFGIRDCHKIECCRATWTFTYGSGYIVNLRGAFTALVRFIPGVQDKSIWLPTHHPGYSMRIQSIAFDAETQEKSLKIEEVLGARVPQSPSLGLGDGDDERSLNDPRIHIPNASIPVEPVNAFGIPQATMRCLELAESVTQMSDLIQFSQENKLGPRDALTKFAERLKDKDGMGRSPGSVMNHLPPNGVVGAPPGPGDMFHASSSALYPGPPPNGPAPSHLVSSPAAMNGTPKPSHAVPHQPQTSGSTPGPSATTPSSAATPSTMTPVTQPASLKRKNPGAGDAVSPTTSNSEPTKRAPRKRTRTQNGS